MWKPATSGRQPAWFLGGTLMLFVFLSITAVQGADCNGNGREDLVDVQLAESEDCNANGLPDECEGVPIILGLGEETLEVSGRPSIIEPGDVDGDGDDDLVQISGDARNYTLRVILNDGDRTLVVATEYALDAVVFSVALGDVDGDGDLDMAAAGETLSREPGLSVFLGNGDGTFAQPVHYEHSFATRLVSLMDVDGNASVDLVAANHHESTVTVRLNVGDGTFGAPRDIQTSAAPLNAPRGVASGDFDRDGDLDLATVNRRLNDLTVVANQGGGTFSAPVSYALDGTFPHGLEAADVNRDGWLDLVALTTKEIAVFLNLEDGTFSEAITYATAETSVFSLVDLNGDADVDVVLAGISSGLVVHVNDGTGNFAVSVEFASLPFTPLSLAASDFDLDGDPDVAFSSLDPSSIRFLWNGDDTPALAVRRETIPLVDDLCHQNVGCRPHSAAVADFDNDGDLDYVAGIPWPASLTALMNHGGRLVPLPNRPYGNNQTLTIDSGDLNGDGIVDLVTVDTSDSKLRAHIGNGDGTFEANEGTVSGAFPLSVKLADLDGDDDLDAVVANNGGSSVSFLFNDGDAKFELRRESTRQVPDPLAVDAADFDGDGLPDVAVADAGRAEVLVLINAGDGTFPTSVAYPLPQSPGSLVATDMDGVDGPDIVAMTAGAMVAILINRGDGSFRRAVSYTTWHNGRSIVATDFNGDTYVDVVTASESTGTVSVLIGRGDGTVREPRVFETGNGMRAVHAADFDLDGDQDLITADRAVTTVTVLYNESEREASAASFSESICTAGDFHILSAAAGESSVVDRFVKYTLPVGEGRSHLAGAVFQNTNTFPLHEDFLPELLPDQFAGLTPQEYNSLISLRATRRYFVGAISRLPTSEGHVYGFGVFARWSDPAEQLTASEVKDIYDELRASFHLEPFVYLPTTRAAIQVASDWEAPGFPIRIGPTTPTGFGYEAYTRGIAFGRVRILDPAEFELANNRGEFGFQEILILHEAPRDIDGVVGAAFTAELQGELSHLAIRLARRGSPNAYAADALERFEPFDGKLVRIEVKRSGFSVEEASLEDAEAWWAASRPELSVLPRLDPDFAELSSLAEIAAMELEAEAIPVVARFGGKASGLARLQPILDGDWMQYQEVGFAIPVHYYFEFMRINRIPSKLDGSMVTYEEYLTEILNLPGFRTDSSFRFAELNSFQDFAQSFGRLPDGLETMLIHRIEEVFGTTTSRVRFRSSSNVEDAIEFNGAGLYESTSVCAADDLDDDNVGPSQCQAFRANERGIARGLKRVWTSLWNFRAHEERAFFGIPPELVAMGILVNRAFVDEQANGVAFTGDPTGSRDRRYVVTVQAGEESVVSPEPGVLPEKDLLEVVDGRVVEIVRAVPSSLMPRGEYVLSEEQLHELGGLLSHIDDSYPIDTGDHPRENVLLDIEFKIEATGDGVPPATPGELAVKQVRPFLLTDPGPPPPTFELVVPEGMMACGRFDIFRDPRQEYDLKSIVRFVGGTVLLPAGAGSFSGEIIEELVFGPEREVAVPEGPGRFGVEEIVSDDGEIVYRFEFEQGFTLSDGRQITLALSLLDYLTVEDGTEPVEPTRRLDEALADVNLRSVVEEDGSLVTIAYSSCTHETLPVWEVRAEMADGTSILLEERYRPEENEDFGPASLFNASVNFVEGHREVSDYFHLVYSADRHNVRVIYWVVLEPPVAVPNIDEPVGAVALHAPIERDDIPAQAFYLGEDFGVISPIGILSYEKERVADSALERPFRRGDVDANARVNLTDAIVLLQHLFGRAAAPPCASAADANDNGNLEIGDGLAILLYVFLGQETLAEPLASCGVDPTWDDLGCAAYRACD